MKKHTKNMLSDREKEAKLRALREAANIGFDALDQGRGIILKSAGEIDDFLKEIAAEVVGPNARKGKLRP